MVACLQYRMNYINEKKGINNTIKDDSDFCLTTIIFLDVNLQLQKKIKKKILNCKMYICDPLGDLLFSTK